MDYLLYVIIIAYFYLYLLPQILSIIENEKYFRSLKKNNNKNKK